MDIVTLYELVKLVGNSMSDLGLVLARLLVRGIIIFAMLMRNSTKLTRFLTEKSQFELNTTTSII